MWAKILGLREEVFASVCIVICQWVRFYGYCLRRCLLKLFFRLCFQRSRKTSNRLGLVSFLVVAVVGLVVCWPDPSLHDRRGWDGVCLMGGRVGLAGQIRNGSGGGYFVFDLVNSSDFTFKSGWFSENGIFL